MMARARHGTDETGWSLGALVRADFRSFLQLEQVRPRSVARALDILSLPGFLAVLLYRLSAASQRAGLRPVARLLYVLNVMLFSADLSPDARIGPGLVIPHPTGVVIAPTVRVGSEVHLFSGVTLGIAGYIDDPSRDGFPSLGDGCWIMDGAKVFGPIEVGHHSIVGANSVLLQSLAPGSVAVGSPARVVRYRPGFGAQLAGATASQGGGA